MTDTATTFFAAALGFGWTALALAFFLRESGLLQSLQRVWRGRSALARFAAVAAIVVATVYGGSKPSGTGGVASMSIPRPTVGINAVQAGDASTNALRFTAFAFDGEGLFDFSIAWPATNLPEYAAIDVFYKQTLDDPVWRWIYRSEVWPEYGENEFTLDGGNLPYWEEVVSRRFRVDTNAVESPFGVVFTNLYARVPELTDAAPRSAFFMLANQCDADHDGLSDAVERSLGYDPLNPDMDGDGLPDGQELSLGANPLVTDSDGDGLLDGEEASWWRSSTDGLSRWIDTSAVARTVLFTDADDDCVSVPMPFSIHLAGVAMTNLTVNANGLVGFSAGESAFGRGMNSNGNASALPLAETISATVAAFWSDLRVRPDMDSEVALSVYGKSPERTGVIEFSRVGFYSGGTNNYVSFQLQFREEETNAVHVVFLEASGLGTGASATLGAHSSRDDGVEYSRNEAGFVFPGLHLEYHFGIGSSLVLDDTDDDGLSDGEEVLLGTDPLVDDSDEDGLSDYEEVQIGTNPIQSDTDGDGFPDNWEFTFGFDPLDMNSPRRGVDSDDDGLTDEVEFLHGTNPLVQDTDDDGLSDGQEILSFMTNPLAVDTDGDGISDLDEVGLVSIVPYAWHDAGVAQNLLLSGNTPPFSILLATPFFADGVSHTSLSVDTNGVVFILGPGDVVTNSTPKPLSITAWNGSPAHLGVAALWTELETDALSSLKYFEIGDAAVVEFSDFLDGVPWIRSGDEPFRSAGLLRVAEQRRVSMQVVLPRTVQDTILVYYREIPDGGLSAGAVVGIQNRDRGYFSLPEGFYTLPRPGDLALVPESGTGLCYRLGLGTNPLVPDTDDDGLDDGAEISAGTDPLDQDTDGDGVSDAVEVESGTNPNDADDSVGYQSAFVIGNAGENVAVPFSQTFSVPAGTTALVDVWATSREYPDYTSDTSEFNDTLAWTVKTNGIRAISGRTNVNALHARFAEADDAGEVVPGLTGPAVSLGAFFVEAPTNSAISVMAEFEVTNISDGARPSSLMVALYPLRVFQDNWPESGTSTDFGNRHSKRILRDGVAYLTGEPAAPQLKASFAGLPGFVDVGWKLDLTSERTERGTLDDRHMPSSGWIDKAGDMEWDIAAALDEIVGGKAVVSSQIDKDKTCSTSFFIRGKNPLDAVARAYINANIDEEFQPYAWMIAKHESKAGNYAYNQFNAYGSKNELPNFAPPAGWGIAQIDKGQNGDTTAEVYDWHENIASMNATLREKKTRFYERFIGYYRDAYANDPSTMWIEPADETTNINGYVVSAEMWSVLTLYNGTQGIPQQDVGSHHGFQSPLEFCPTTTNWVFHANVRDYVSLVLGDRNESEVE